MSDHITEPPHAVAKWSIARLFERFIYGGRWLLSPMYVGLLVVLGLYVWHYLTGLIELVHAFRSITETEIMLAALATVDAVMVANLLVFIMIGSYSIFVRSIVGMTADQPNWLKTITSGTLKIKMGGSLIGISSIQLLRDFIGTEIAPDLLYKHVGVHLVFLVSTIALAYSDKLSHGSASDIHQPEHT